MINFTDEYLRYWILAKEDDSQEDLLWTWESNPLSGFGGSEDEQNPILGEFDPDITDLPESVRERVIALAKGAASLEIDEEAGQKVIWESLPGYDEWVKEAKSQWVEKAKGVYGDLPDLTIEEAIAISRYQELENEEIKDLILEHFGMEVFASEVILYMEKNHKYIWWDEIIPIEEDRVSPGLWSRYQVAKRLVDAKIESQRLERQRLEKERKAELAAKKAAEDAKKRLPTGKVKPVLKKR